MDQLLSAIGCAPGLLQVRKLGPKLVSHEQGPPYEALTQPPVAKAPNGTPNVFPPICDAYMLNSTLNHPMKLGSRNTTIALIASSLPTVQRFGRPVVDQSGLSGRY